jgi:hypothetical protein
MDRLDIRLPKGKGRRSHRMRMVCVLALQPLQVFRSLRAQPAY